MKSKNDPVKTVLVEITNPEDLQDFKNLLLFMAERISKTFSSIGFFPATENNAVIMTGRREVVQKIEKIFSDIIFIKNEIVSVKNMSSGEAKFYLNIVSAFVSGRNPIAGSLSFPPELNSFSVPADKDRKYDIKILEIGKGPVSLAEVKGLFENIRFVSVPVIEKSRQVEKEYAPITVLVPVSGTVCCQEA